MLGILFFLCLVLWFHNKGSSLHKKHLHTRPSGLINTIAYLYALLMFTGFIAIFLKPTEKWFEFFCISFFVLLLLPPFLLSKITISFSLVKPSYYFAKFAFLYNQKSLFAGGLFAGYKAAIKLPSIESKQEGLRWLRNKYLKIDNKRKLSSGEILVYVLIDSELTHPGNNDYLVERLSIVSKLSGSTVPDPIWEYSIKRCLAKALPSSDWDQVMKVIGDWGGSSTQLSSYINAFYERNVLKKKKLFTTPFFVKELRMFRLGSVKKWCCERLDVGNSNKQTIGNREQAITMVWGELVNKKEVLSALINANQKEIWEARAIELGVHDKDIWLDISNGVAQKLAEEQLSEEQMKFIDDQHQALKYIEQNIKKKWGSYSYKNSAERSVDFLQFFYTFNKLSIEKSEQLNAFRVHSSFLWDAIANLWNDKKEYCLAYMVASLCKPHAKECGLTDFGKTISFVMSK